jgi:hypothetical protein
MRHSRNRSRTRTPSAFAHFWSVENRGSCPSWKSRKTFLYSMPSSFANWRFESPFRFSTCPKMIFATLQA